MCSHLCLWHTVPRCLFCSIHATINYSRMFDTEDSDSDADEGTLAWIDHYPQLGLNAKTFGFLWQGAVESVPLCINGENNLETHAEETLAKILEACSRDDVDSIRDTQDARDLISRKLLILEQSERLRRGQEEEQRRRESIRVVQYRAGLTDEERRTSERIRSQDRRARLPDEERRTS